MGFGSSRPLFPSHQRTDEILGWLERRPDVDRFAIIDDEDDGLDDLPLFQPSCRTGLTEKITKGVEAYLTGSTDKDMRCGDTAVFPKPLGRRQGPSRLSKGRVGNKPRPRSRWEAHHLLSQAASE